MSHSARTTTATATTTTASLVVAGLAFAAYPVLRPQGPETGLAGAADFAALAWLVAHVLGMTAFVALAFALRSAAVTNPWSWTGRPLHRLETAMWAAVVLLLPYYGAEAYGLNAVGRYATEHADPRMLEIADAFRYAPFELTTFGVGLVLLALVGGSFAGGLRRAGTIRRVGGLMAGAGLVTYLPQFFGPAEVRIVHGLVLGAGLLLVALAPRRPSGESGMSAQASSRPTSQPASPGQGDAAVHAESGSV